MCVCVCVCVYVLEILQSVNANLSRVFIKPA